MKKTKIAAVALASLMSVSALAGCNKTPGASSGTAAPGETKQAAPGQIKEFSAFFAVPATTEINKDNEVQKLIAEKIGAKCNETWLAGQQPSEAVGVFIASGEYPDFINGGDAMKALYEAGALIAWDDYIDKYPNIKEFFSDYEWSQFRQSDGKIYWMNPFENIYGEDKTTTQNGEAFWIQARVLEWAKYPKIETLDDYFKVLEDYNKANPTTHDGKKNIPYTMLCEGWRYFCLENAPQFLDGYPNDGSCMVDVNTKKIMDYNTTPTAKRYFKKLNEEYAKGNIDPDFAIQTYDEYIAKLSTGGVLGMCDQNWDFNFTITDVFKQSGLDKQGCNYIPLGLTIEPGMVQRWHSYGDTLNMSSGVAITTSCDDIDAAFQFLDDLCTQEIRDLRFWGVEGVDYEVDADGMFYRTEEQRTKLADPEYKASHVCQYSYMPQYNGTSTDGKNANKPEEQTSEFFDTLAEPVVKCFEAYGVSTYPEMVGSVVEENAPWYPMYSYSNNMTTDTPGGVAWVKMGETKHEWLPKVVMSTDFESTWNEYMDAYNACNPQDFLDEMQVELERRAGK